MTTTPEKKMNQVEQWQKEVEYFEAKKRSLQERRMVVPMHLRSGLKFAKECLKDAKKKEK